MEIKIFKSRGDIIKKAILCLLVLFILMLSSCEDKPRWDHKRRDWGPLLSAAYNGDTEKIRSLINDGLDVNERSTIDGYTALEISIRKQNYLTVETLLMLNADVNLSDEQGITPLMLACQLPDFRIVELLLSYEAYIDTVDKNGGTALFYAVTFGSNDSVKVLIQKDVSLNYQDSVGNTSLMKAVYFGYYEKVQLLVDAGADIKVKNNNNETALDVNQMWKEKNPNLFNKINDLLTRK